LDVERRGTFVKLNSEINGWLMVLVVLVTAGITSWVMLRNRPDQRWNSPYSYPPQQVALGFSPGMKAADICTGCHPVISTIPNTKATKTLPHDHRGICSNCHRLSSAQNAVFMAVGGQKDLNTGIPAIRAGAPVPHADRGSCTNCHTVLSSSGNPIPDISATSTQPHETRGFCSNCHRLASQVRVNTGQGGAQAVTPVASMGQAIAARPTAPPSTAPEGEWMGLEVAPITSLTANQYNIPYGTQGLVVAEAEGQAAAAGLRAGDVLLSVNGASISNMTDFFQATWNGTQTQGVVEVLRKGEVLSLNIAQTTNPGSAAITDMPKPATQGGMPAAMPTPRNDTSVSPENAAGWSGPQGLGNVPGWCPGPGYVQ
jgi:hypothetical protein